MVLKTGMGYIGYVHQKVGFAHLIEGGFERFHQFGRQFADKADGIGEQDGQVGDNDLAHRRIEGGEELVLGKDVRLAQQVHQGRFSDVGITYQRYTDGLSPVFALGSHLTVDRGEFFLEQGDAVAHDTAVGLDLGLSRTAHSDTAPLAFQVRPHAGKTGKKVLVLRQFHLGAGIGSLRPGGEDVEDEVGTVENLPSQLAFDVAQLSGGEFVVEDHYVHLRTVGEVGLDLLQFSGTDERAGVGRVELLPEALDHPGSGRLGEELQLVEVFRQFELVLLGRYQPHQDGCFVFHFFVFDHSHIDIFLWSSPALFLRKKKDKNGRGKSLA